MVDFSHPFQTLGTAPIPGDSPAGINARYESAYEQLNAELAKLESVSGEKVDWHVIEQLSAQLLSSVSKDFAVASYLTYALTVQQGYSGLRSGFSVINDLIDHFWESGFPAVSRLRGRKSPLEWLAEKLCLYVASNPPSAPAYSDSIECYNLLKNIDFSLRDRMQDSAPELAELNRALKQIKQSAEFELQKVSSASQPVTQVANPDNHSAASALPVPDTTPPTEAPAVAHATSAAVASAAPVSAPKPPVSQPEPQRKSAEAVTASAVTIDSSELASEADAKRLLRQIQDAQRQLASYYAAQKAADPRRYRLSRSALWDGIDKLPPAKDGKTQLPKPPVDKLQKCEDLLHSKQFTELLQQAEVQATKLPYWFDGNRYIAEALAELGGEYLAARDALLDEISQFIKRVPGIADLHYSDGTPFASDTTKFWLKSLATTEAVDTPAGSDALSDVLAAAGKAAASGKLPQALEILRRDYAPVNSREKYRIRLASAELILNSGKPVVAIPLLEQLIQQGEAIAAEDWEPDFFAHAYDLLVKAYSASGNTSDVDEARRSSAFNRLCWLDPAMASVI